MADVIDFPAKKLLKLKEAVSYLEHKGYPIKESTLRNKLYLGEGPERVYQFGRPYFRPADLDRWLDQHRVVRKAYS